MKNMDGVFLDIFKNFIKEYWYILAILIVLNIVRELLRINKAKIKGYFGEKALSYMLESLPKDEYRVLNNIMIRSLYGTSQIDHIVISIYGVFVIETKTYSGWIYGKEKEKTWTQNIYGNNFSFQNPIHQNYGHIKALENLNPLFKKHIDFVSIIAFSDEAELKNDIKNVTYFSKIIDTIKEYNEVIYSKDDMINIYEYIKKKNITSTRERKNHVRRIKKKLAKDS